MARDSAKNAVDQITRKKARATTTAVAKYTVELSIYHKQVSSCSRQNFCIIVLLFKVIKPVNIVQENYYARL